MKRRPIWGPAVDPQPTLIFNDPPSRCWAICRISCAAVSSACLRTGQPRATGYRCTGFAGRCLVAGRPPAVHGIQEILTLPFDGNRMHIAANLPADAAGKSSAALADSGGIFDNAGSLGSVRIPDATGLPSGERSRCRATAPDTRRPSGKGPCLRVPRQKFKGRTVGRPYPGTRKSGSRSGSMDRHGAGRCGTRTGACIDLVLCRC